MKRKAQQTDLKSIILILIIGTILLTFAGATFVPWYKIFGEQNACQISILASAKSQKELAGTKIGPSFNLDCPVQEKIIKYEKFRNKDGSINSLKVKGELAKEMYNCWNKVGEGKLDPFKDWEGDPTYCLICSQVTFDKEFIDKAGDPTGPNAPLKDFAYYLGTEYVPGKNFTFYRYFYQKDAQELSAEARSQLANLDYINYTTQNTILWRAEIDGHSPWKTAATVGGATVAIAAVAIGLALIPATGGMSVMVAMAWMGGNMAGGGFIAATAGTVISGAVTGSIGYFLADGRKANMELFLIPTEWIDSKIAEGENEGERFCEVLAN
jgi:hypothetical protein